MIFNKSILIFTGVIIALASVNVYSQKPEEFKSPDDSNKPITYWMWQNGNITKSGLTKDLEAMKEVGITGTLMFSVGMFEPGPVKFMSIEWWDAMGHAIKESNRLHMQFGVYNSDGWSMSGGPWITPEESMKQIVWADTTILGGKKVNLKLPQPTINLIYEDISVVAYPAIKNERQITGFKIASTNMVNKPESGFDDNSKTAIIFKKPEGNKIANLVLDFGRKTPIRRIVFDEVSNNPFLDANMIVEYSDNGRDFTKVVDNFPLNLKAESMIKQFSLSFPEVNARYLRLSLTFVSYSTWPVEFHLDEMGIGEIKFYQSPRISLWEPKSGQSKRVRHDRQQIFMKELSGEPNLQIPSDYLISQSKQIDLSSFVDENGVLNWNAPVGDWTIQRFGYTSTNRMIGPATKEGKGLEVNKMDSKAVEKHFNSYTGKINDLSVKMTGKPLAYMHMESWEAGIQNWTKGFEKEFEKRNGYSILPYLPVVAGGHIVNSYLESDKFLWDFRNTIAQLIAEKYWGTMYECSKKRGILVSGEGSGMQHYLYDPMRYQQFTDIPMGEFWPNEGHSRPDVKSAASVAHTYGKALSGGESFTSGDVNLWSKTPYMLKQIGDEAFVLGLNHLVLHTYIHQPYDVAPGFTLGRFGNHFQRLNPWFTQATGWFNYFARNQYMLRQGKSVQDIAYFIGEGIPSYLGMSWELHPKLPEGYDYDGVNYDIIKKMTVKNGVLHLPSGAQYKLLVFQDINRMTPELLKEIKRLVNDGATLVSLKPEISPSLEHKAVANADVKKMADEMWCKGNDGVHSFGKGKIYSRVPLNEVLNNLKSTPDFIYKSDDPDAVINYIHRKTDTSDVYLLSNYNERKTVAKATFRVTNKMPELWDPDKGTTEALSYRIVAQNQIEVPLTFDPLGAFFIVFKGKVVKNEFTVPPLKILATKQVNSIWDVAFINSITDFKVKMDKLTDWSKSSDPRIKYFSGSAIYMQDFNFKLVAGSKVEVDLGVIANNNIVSLSLNGQKIASLWKPPYKADITSALKNGNNQLEITVTNTATNSLIGDERFPADLQYEENGYTKGYIKSIPSWLAKPSTRNSERKTFVTFKYLHKDSKLDPSGMLGPVTIKISTSQE